MYEFLWQPCANLDVLVDADFSGCPAAQRGTSGGAAPRCSYLIKHKSSRQKAVTLSSAEAELCGIARSTTEAHGIWSVGRDLAQKMTLRIHTDSAVAVRYLQESWHRAG